MPASVERGQYIYIVCSNGADYFTEMAAISATTLRLVSPEARIVVLTDRQTATLDTPAGIALRNAIDDCLAIDCDGKNAMFRSRVLKTDMRRIVHGRLLYLDSDTIVMRSPDAIWNLNCDVSAAPDLSTVGQPYAAATALPGVREALGWKFGVQPYLNAGVMYLADNDSTRALTDSYHQSWLEFLRSTGKPNDQPAFNHAVAHSARLAILPSSFNAQIAMNAMALRGAAIVHYYSGDFENADATIAHVAAKRLRREGMLDLAGLSAAIASHNPWTRIDSYQKALASRRYWNIGLVTLERLRRRTAIGNPACRSVTAEGAVKSRNSKSYGP